jgi:hypothetical protein
MAAITGGAMLAMGALSLAPSLIGGITSFFKSRKTKKKAKQLAAMNAMRTAQLQAQLRAMQGGNLMASTGLTNNYMQPMGMQNGYGPAPQGYFPQSMG